MSEWKKTTIGDLIASGGGSIKTGPFGTTLKACEYTKMGVPLISVGEVGYGSFRIHDTTPRVPPEVTSRLPEFILREGDIVFGRKGAVDRSARIGIEQIGWFLGSDGIRLRLPETTDSKFMAYQLQSQTLRQWILQHATGTTMASLNQNVIERIPVVLPPIATQRAIAHILGSLDDKIELNRKLNKTLEDMARALFQSWFVDFDPVRAKALGLQPSGMDADTQKLFADGFEMSELGEIPRAWRVATIGHLGQVVTGKTPSKADTNFFGTAYPFIKIPDMHGRVWVNDTEDGLSEAGHQEQPGKLVPPKSIAVSCIATVGLTSLVRYPSHTNQQINVIIPTENTSWAWLFFAVRHIAPLIEARSLGGSVTKNLNKGQFELIQLLVPPAAIQYRFEQAVSCLLEAIAQKEDESTHLASIRDALLPRLLSGEIPIKNAERFIASQG